MSNFAVLKYPHEECCKVIQTNQDVELLNSYKELNNKNGLVFSPLYPTTSKPIILINNHNNKTYHLKQAYTYLSQLKPQLNNNIVNTPIKEKREHYAQMFNIFHQNVENNIFQKLVLAHSIAYQCNNNINIPQLYIKACNNYPNMLVAWISTTNTGTWIMATPEILLKKRNNKWNTIALAGTMEKKGEWSKKNINEQNIVQKYLIKQISTLTNNISQNKTHTINAANLWHLRSDIYFTINNNTTIADIINTIHPTPAVCGLPKQKAIEFILNNELDDRGYYSGFIGEISTNDNIDLYVTLRCMEICQNGYIIHAGGGIMPDSKEENEWNETINKMKSMKKLFSH